MKRQDKNRLVLLLNSRRKTGLEEKKRPRILLMYNRMLTTSKGK